MSGLLGAVATNGASVPSLDQAATLLLRHEEERSASATTGAASVTSAALPSSSRPERVWKGDGVLVALHGSAHWANESHSASLQRTPTPGQSTKEARAIVPVSTAVTLSELARAYLQQGPALLERICGAFALAIVVDRPERREAMIATDRLGIEIMCFHAGPRGLVFGTRADAVASLSGSAAIDPQALYDYLYFHMVPAPRTVFVGVERLLPGSYALWQGGRSSVRSYWAPRFVEDGRRTAAELRPDFHHVLQLGVTRALPSGPPGGTGSVGCFLSGGTDSSTVCGVLGQVTGMPPRGFSIGFAAPGYDEMEFARAAARRFAIDLCEYYVTPDDVADAVEHVSAAYDQPFGNASVVPAYYCARLARSQGVTRMLAGDGGDELYGGNARYATQALFSMYHQIPSVLRHGLVEPLLAPLPDAGLLRKAKNYIAQANVPLPARLQTYNLLERLGVAKLLHGDFLGSIDTAEPSRLTQETYDGAHAATLINRLLAFDLRFTLADSDLPKVNRACELAGVEVAYPLLDPAVVDFSLRLQPTFKLKGQQLRWFFKDALRDFLPREIIEKKKHGFGLPFGVWLRENPRLHQLAGDTLACLGKRHIVNEALLDELMASKVGEHAAYYGTLVWILMTLEMWLQQNRTAAIP